MNEAILGNVIVCLQFSKSKLKIEINSLIKKIYTNRILTEQKSMRGRAYVCDQLENGVNVTPTIISCRWASKCLLIEFTAVEQHFITASIWKCKRLLIYHNFESIYCAINKRTIEYHSPWWAMPFHFAGLPIFSLKSST